MKETTVITPFRRFGLTSASLHVLAMGFMLCDHLWATIIPGHDWLTWIGRLTFPIFAFLLVEGYCHTSNFKKYAKRMLLFAVLSEIPFNLMTGGSLFYPFHQNVLWSFLISLFCMRWIDALLQKKPKWLMILLSVVLAGVISVLGLLTMVDYHNYGILMVLVFRIFRGDRWWQRLGQLAGMVYINCFMMSGQYVPVELFGQTINVYQQSMAVLALIPIWLYNGQKGYHAKWFQYLCYAFYPVHILILSLIALYVI